MYILKVPHDTFLSYLILCFTIHTLVPPSRPHPCGTAKEACKIRRVVKRQSVFLKDTVHRRSSCGHNAICYIWPTQGNWQRNIFHFITHSHKADKTKSWNWFRGSWPLDKRMFLGWGKSITYKQHAKWSKTTQINKHFSLLLKIYAFQKHIADLHSCTKLQCNVLIIVIFI